MNRYLISIIVPVYKVERFLVKCIESVLHQTYKNIEIILVDDGSPDSCPQICDEYTAKDARVKVIHKENGGLSDARNAGLNEATGDYILYVDSDDYIELDACEKLAEGILSEEVDFVVGAAKEINGNKILYQRHSNIEPFKIYQSNIFIIESIKANEWFAPAWLNLYRKEFLLSNKLYYVKDRIYEDIQMLPRLYTAANKIVYVDYAFYNYVIREGSIMTTNADQRKVISAVTNYQEWHDVFSKIENPDLKKFANGFLCKCYMRTWRKLNIKGFPVNGIDKKFLLHNALNLRELLKTIFFIYAPDLYRNVGE